MKNISFVLDIYLKKIQPIIINNVNIIFKKYPEIKNVIDHNKQEFKNIINDFKKTNNYTLEEYYYIKKIFSSFSKIKSECLIFKMLCLNYIKIIKNLLVIINHKNKIIEKLKNDIYFKQIHDLNVINEKNIHLLMYKLKTIEEVNESDNDLDNDSSDNN